MVLNVFTYDKGSPNKTQDFTPSEISILKGWKKPTHQNYLGTLKNM